MAKAKAPRTSPSTNKQVLTMPEAGSVPLVRKSSPVSSPPVDLEAKVRERAYQLYQERGSTPGFEVEDWLKAEREVHARQSHLHTA